MIRLKNIFRAAPKFLYKKCLPVSRNNRDYIFRPFDDNFDFFAPRLEKNRMRN